MTTMQLTDFERELVEGYREGLPVREIARRLDVAYYVVTNTASSLRARGFDLPLHPTHQKKTTTEEDDARRLHEMRGCWIAFEDGHPTVAADSLDILRLRMRDSAVDFFGFIEQDGRVTRIQS